MLSEFLPRGLRNVLAAVSLACLCLCGMSQAQTIPIMQVFEITTTPLGQNMPMQFEDPNGNIIPEEMMQMSIDMIEAVVRPQGGQDFTVDSFFDIEYQIDGPSGPQTFNVGSIEMCRYFTRNPLADRSPDERTWDTEMISMSLSGSSQPGPVLLNMRPVGPGHVTVLKIFDLGGGQFQVDSFFDIHTEISFDNGTTFNTNVDPVNMGAFGLVQIPEPSTAVAIITGLCGLAMWRRRR